MKQLLKNVLEKHSRGDIDLKTAKREAMNQGGVKFVVLHGCASQECDHVYGPGDNGGLCPKCGNSRYFEHSKKPKEAVYHFPICERLEGLLKLTSFQYLLEVIFVFSIDACIHSLFFSLMTVRTCSEAQSGRNNF